MSKWIVVSLVLLSCTSLALAAPPEKSPRIARLAAQVAKHERGAEDAFWAQVAKDGTPILEPSTTAGTMLVTFVWRGVAKTSRVSLFGPSAVQPLPLEHLAGSNVFYVTIPLPDTARFAYMFLIDGQIDGSVPEPPHPDPFNTHIFDPFSSWFAMPKAPAQPSLVLHRETKPGTLTRHMLDKRELYVYTPPGFTPRGAAYPLVVAFDASTAVMNMPMAEILDELIASKQIPPVVAVLVGNVDRGKDLVDDTFTDMIALQLVPWMRMTYHATSDPRRTVITEVSLGGLASAMTALHHPDVFGNVLSQSGSYWWAPQAEEPEFTARWLAKQPRLAVRFWMEVGLFEGAPAGSPTNMLAANRHLRDVLIARGNDVTYSEFAGTHTYLQWRGSLAGGLKSLFATLPKSAAPAVHHTKLAALQISAGTVSPMPAITRAVCLDGGDAAVAVAKQLGASEEETDTAGFAAVYLNHEADSVPLFRWNTERFPRSRNAWDSYAWMQWATGNRKGAKVSFQKELELAPDNLVAKRMLDLL